jgi:hypothetical protein
MEYTVALSAVQHESSRGSTPFRLMGERKRWSQTGKWHNSFCLEATSSLGIPVSLYYWMLRS